MLSITEIEKYYDAALSPFKEMMLKEYLQYKILDTIFNSPYAGKLCFMGGTCLRIVHNNNRFSEDLDFDNQGLSENEFAGLSSLIQADLQKQGYQVQMEERFKGAWHCYIRFPGLLYQQGLSDMQEQKILIQIDTEPQHFSFIRQQVILNKFDVFTTISTTPLPVLLAQKLYAILNRKRNKGRDFYDVVFLSGLRVQPDMAYIKAKTGIASDEELKKAITKKIATLNMLEMAKDVKPFLFNPADEKKVLLFNEYWQQHKL